MSESSQFELRRIAQDFVENIAYYQAMDATIEVDTTEQSFSFDAREIEIEDAPESIFDTRIEKGGGVIAIGSEGEDLTGEVFHMDPGQGKWNVVLAFDIQLGVTGYE